MEGTEDIEDKDPSVLMEAGKTSPSINMPRLNDRDIEVSHGKGRLNDSEENSKENVKDPSVLMEAGVNSPKERVVKNKTDCKSHSVNNKSSKNEDSKAKKEPSVLKAGADRSLASKIERVDKELDSVQSEIQRVDENLKSAKAKFERNLNPTDPEDRKKNRTTSGAPLSRKDGTPVKGILRSKSEPQKKSIEDTNEKDEASRSSSNSSAAETKRASKDNGTNHDKKDEKRGKSGTKRRKKGGKQYSLVNEFDLDNDSSVPGTTTEDECDTNGEGDNVKSSKGKSSGVGKILLVIGVVVLCLALIAVFLLNNKQLLSKSGYYSDNGYKHHSSKFNDKTKTQQEDDYSDNGYKHHSSKFNDRTKTEQKDDSPSSTAYRVPVSQEEQSNITNGYGENLKQINPDRDDVPIKEEAIIENKQEKDTPNVPVTKNIQHEKKEKSLADNKAWLEKESEIGKEAMGDEEKVKISIPQRKDKIDDSEVKLSHKTDSDGFNLADMARLREKTQLKIYELRKGKIKKSKDTLVQKYRREFVKMVKREIAVEIIRIRRTVDDRVLYGESGKNEESMTLTLTKETSSNSEETIPEQDKTACTPPGTPEEVPLFSQKSIEVLQKTEKINIAREKSGRKTLSPREIERREERFRRENERATERSKRDAEKQERERERERERQARRAEKESRKIRDTLKIDNSGQAREQERERMARIAQRDLEMSERIKERERERNERIRIRQERIRKEDEDIKKEQEALAKVPVRELLKMKVIGGDRTPETHEQYGGNRKKKAVGEPLLNRIDEVFHTIDHTSQKLEFKIDVIDALLDKHQFSTARSVYERFLAKYPDEERLWYGRALAVNHMANKNPTEPAFLDAADAYIDVLKQSCIGGETFTVILGLAFNIFKTIRRYDLMYDVMGNLHVTYPNRTAVTYKYVMALMHTRRIEVAREVIKSELAQRPADGFMLVHLAHITYNYDHEYERSIPLWEAAFATSHPSIADKRYYGSYGDALQRIGKRIDAYKIFRRGAALGLFLGAVQRSPQNVNRLSAHPWWSTDNTNYALSFKVLQKAWRIIRDEGLHQLSNRSSPFLPEPGEWDDHGQWAHFTLFANGKRNYTNCALCPKTCNMLSQFPAVTSCVRCQVKFTLLTPGTHVIPHCGPSNCRIRNQLGLVTSRRAKIRVTNESREWTEGRWLSYDDSFEHEMRHDGYENQLLLTVDVWHPELTEEERAALWPV